MKGIKMPSIFTKIIRGELPCYKVHEDELTLSILALDQVNLGHTLVIPKKEIDHWIDVEDTAYLAVAKNAKKIGAAIKKATECPRVGIMVAGFEVPHYHLHLIPAWGIPDLNFSKAKRRTEAEMQEIQKKILENLSNV
jgi:histidine triad (HIT) family protein